MIVAHRGASRDAPENTIPAFEMAWAQGADGIEGDVHLTQDGEIVCIHDRNTERVAGRRIVVAQATLAELKALDVGAYHDRAFAGATIPTLAEVFATVPARKQVYVEIKCGQDIIPALLDTLKTSGLEHDQIVVISFDSEVLRNLKTQAPQCRAFWLCSFTQETTGAITPSPDTVLNVLERIQANGLSTNTEIPESLIETLHSHGYQWHVWTVDNPATAKQMQAMGAASITTNIPGAIKKALADGPPCGNS